MTARRRFRLRLSLRWRVAVSFGLMSLLITSVLAGVTWKLSSGYMLEQREQSATTQASVNVRLVGDALRSGSQGLTELLEGLAAQPRTTVLLNRDGRWLSSGRDLDPKELPDELISMARDGSQARQRLSAGGIPALAVVSPVGPGSDVYIQLFPLVELDRILHFLSALLIGGVAASGLAGFALGRWTSQRALRPLAELNIAAARVAHGDLDARLPSQNDPDLSDLAAAFNETAEALEERVRRDTRFASDVSHELRSPLTTMLNAGEVLNRRRMELQPTGRRALDLLFGELQRFQAMVLDLLEISRLDEPDEPGRCEVIDLATLVKKVLAARHEDVPVDIEQPPPLVSADRRRVDRVVSNLLDNAHQHGGGAVRVRVRRAGGRVRLEVDDQGPGVAEHMRSRIFDRFARGNAAGHRPAGTSTGLGLAIVLGHVRRERGDVWVEDRPEGGARFVVELAEAQP